MLNRTFFTLKTCLMVEKSIELASSLVVSRCLKVRRNDLPNWPGPMSDNDRSRKLTLTRHIIVVYRYSIVVVDDDVLLGRINLENHAHNHAMTSSTLFTKRDRNSKKLSSETLFFLLCFSFAVCFSSVLKVDCTKNQEAINWVLYEFSINFFFGNLLQLFCNIN